MAIIKKFKAVKTKQNHLLGIQDLSFSDVSQILEEAKTFIDNENTIVAAERNAEALPGFDFGKSPFQYMTHQY